ncbi:MAG: tetratricopeptide repeat protein [Gloeomargarita sp. SKYG116]|nr:tetratricopeptide repeat protein [Gloeomargarita sp. SKYG116]MDW8400184.1 tetratricopeptide repeat protein [Gloeomargarita sp. SKYGB_i_bin116]
MWGGFIAMLLVTSSCAPNVNKIYEEGALALKQGRPQEAVTKLNEVIRLRPDYLEAYEQRGIAYLKLGEYREAVRDLTKALEGKPDNPVILRHRAIAYFGMGKPDQGNADLCRAAEVTKDTKVLQSCAARQQAEQQSPADNPG